MTNFHLTEQAMQVAAEFPALLPPPEAAHLHGCPQCQQQVATYQQLFVAAAQLPQPAFAFDLTASVLAQLPQASRAVFPWALAGVTVLVMGVVVVFIVLFGAMLTQAFQGLFTTGFGLGLAAVVGLLAAGQGLELFVRHRQQMHRLAYS